MRPDDPFADQEPDDPQSWNLYGYVRNNPLSYVDPDGHHQVCGDQSVTMNDGGAVVVNANCTDIPDSFLFPEVPDTLEFSGVRGSGNTPSPLPQTLGSPSAQQACVSPTAAQSAVITALKFGAKLTGLTLGFGVGLSGGLGPGFGGPGIAGSGSMQVVVSPSGQAALEKSSGIGAASGTGGVGGLQFSVSNAPTPRALAGMFGQFGAGAADVLGGGVDVAFANGIWQGTGTVGGGAGGFAALSATSNTSATPFCRQ